MYQKERCPWCGKKADPFSRMKYDKVFMRVPSFMKINRCVHCRHYYGQNVYASKAMRILNFCLIPVVLFSYLLQNAWLLLIYAIILFPTPFLLPVERLHTEEDDYIEEPPTLIFRAVLLQSTELKERCWYFLSDRFDKAEPFSIIAPIVISDISKDNHMEGSFLYHHPQTQTLLQWDKVKLFDDEMNFVGEIKFETISEKENII